MVAKVITPQQQMRAAQSFNFFSVIAILVPVLIPVWIAASIFVYAAVAHHPNPLVRRYLTYAGYRFYGLVGTLVIVLNFSPQMARAAGGGLYLGGLIWIVGVLIVVPWGVRDILRAKNELWQNLVVEAEND